MDIDSLERAFSLGTAPMKERKLTALGVAIALRGDHCIGRHVRDALEAGATRDDLRDAVRVALAIGGGLPATYERRLDHAVEELDTISGSKRATAEDVAVVRR